MEKTILITGCSTGIGFATAKHFSELGWNVAATLRTPDKTPELATLQNTKVYALDVTKPENIKEVVSKVIEDFSHIDALVNNAGIGNYEAFEESTDENIRAVFEVNVFGLINMTKAVLPYMTERKEGTIVNITSVGGRFALPFFSSYNGTKFAVEGISESMMYELKSKNIKVRIVEPGGVATQFGATATSTTTKSLEESEYSELRGKMDKVFAATATKSSSPLVIAKVIEKAVNEKSSKLRFTAGKDAKLIMKAHKVLPDAVFFKTLFSRLS